MKLHLTTLGLSNLIKFDILYFVPALLSEFPQTETS